MAHDVSFNIPERTLGKADVEFKVRSDGVSGTLKVSKGSVVWVEKNNKYGTKITWAKLAACIRESGSSEKG